MAAITRGKLIRADQALYDGKTLTASRPDATGGTTSGLTVDNTVDVLQVFGNGVTQTDAAISAALNRIGSSAATIVFAPGTWTISASITIPQNIVCIVPAGVIFSVDVGKTLTFAGSVHVDYPTAWNSGAGTVVVSRGGLHGAVFLRTAAELAAGVTPVNYYYEPGNVLRYGTNSTPGTTDMTTAIVAALSANAVVTLPDQNCLISSTITVSDNKTLRGGGSNVSIITTNANTFDAITIASNARRVRLSDFSIVGASVGASNAAISIHVTGGCAQSTFEHLKIATFFTGILYGDLFWDSTVRDVRCDGCTRGAFSAGTAGTNLNIVWERFYSEEHTVVGWQCSSVFNYNLIDCNFGGELGGGQSQALIVLANSTLKAQGCNFESHLVAAGSGVVRVISAASVEFDTCIWASNAGAAATGYELDIDNSAIVHVKNCRVITQGANMSDVQLTANAQLIKYDDGLDNVVHASGSAATSIVRSPYQAQQVMSDQIDLSGAAVQRTLYVPKRAGRVTRIAVIYPEATSADAGVNLTVRSGDSVFTYATFTSHVSLAQWAKTEIALGTTAIEAARPIVVACAGGKVGTGEAVIVMEFAED